MDHPAFSRFCWCPLLTGYGNRQPVYDIVTVNTGVWTEVVGTVTVSLLQSDIRQLHHCGMSKTIITDAVAKSWQYNNTRPVRE